MRRRRASGPSPETLARSRAFAEAALEPHGRAKQPGRRVRRRAACPADVDADAAGYDGNDDSDNDCAARRVCGGASTSRAERMERLFSAFKRRRPRATSDLLVNVVAADGFRDDARSLVEAKLQALIDSAVERHCCFSRGVAQEAPVVVGRRSMVVQDVSRFYRVTVLRLRCVCGEWEVQAEECGCFPASPVDPVVWFMTEVLEFYDHLLARGLSVEGTAAACGWQREPKGRSSACAADAHRRAQASLRPCLRCPAAWSRRTSSAPRTWSTNGACRGLRRPCGCKRALC